MFSQFRYNFIISHSSVCVSISYCTRSIVDNTLHNKLNICWTICEAVCNKPEAKIKWHDIGTYT